MKRDKKSLKKRDKKSLKDVYMDCFTTSDPKYRSRLSKLRRLRKLVMVGYGIKFVYNYYYFYNFILKREG